MGGVLLCLCPEGVGAGTVLVGPREAEQGGLVLGRDAVQGGLGGGKGAVLAEPMQLSERGAECRWAHWCWM